MDFVCVFLTSHADFLYAKEAIQLNCFDYILQPARYDEIQATVARAIARVKDTSAVKELLHYGAIAKSQEAALFQNLFSDWSAAVAVHVVVGVGLVKGVAPLQPAVVAAVPVLEAVFQSVFDSQSQVIHRANLPFVVFH